MFSPKGFTKADPKTQQIGPVQITAAKSWIGTSYATAGDDMTIILDRCVSGGMIVLTEEQKKWRISLS